METVETGDRLQFARTSVKRAASGWRVSVPTDNGETLEYEYPTRRYARYIAAIFRMSPTWFPPPHRVRKPAPETTTAGVPREHPPTNTVEADWLSY